MRSIARLQQRSQALESEIRRSREQLDLVQYVAGVGSWEITLDDDWIALSRQAREILGLNGLARMPLSQLLELMCLSGDRGEFLAAVKRARTGRKEFNVEFRVKAEGKPRLLLAHGRTFYNSGQPVIVGVLKQQEDSDGVKLRPAPARPGRNSEV
jgi:PAS domain-containing protein